MTNAHDSSEIKPIGQDGPLLRKWKLVSAIMVDPDLSATARVVAARLMWHTNCVRDAAWPSLTTMANDLNLSRQTIVTACHALRDAGWIEVAVGEHKSNTYRFNWTRMPNVMPGDDIPQTGGESKNYTDAGTNIRPEEGKGTREGSSVSSVTPQKQSTAATSPKTADKAVRWNRRPLAERMGSDGNPQLEGGGIDYAAICWEIQLPKLKALHLANLGTPITDRMARGRLAKVIKEKGPYGAAVFFREMLKVGPGGNPFDYAAKVISGEKETEAGVAQRNAAELDFF